MNQRLHDEEYTALYSELTEAENVRQRIVDRFRTGDGPPALDDPIWEQWGQADEQAGHAREAVRSFLAADEHSRIPQL